MKICSFIFFTIIANKETHHLGAIHKVIRLIRRAFFSEKIYNVTPIFDISSFMVTFDLHHPNILVRQPILGNLRFRSEKIYTYLEICRNDPEALDPDRYFIDQREKKFFRMTEVGRIYGCSFFPPQPRPSHPQSTRASYANANETSG